MEMFLFFWFVCSALIVGFHSLPSDLFEGDKCKNSGLDGLCTLKLNCPRAVEEVKQKGSHNLKRCGFDNFTEIVCCPVENSLRISEQVCDNYKKQFSVSIERPNLSVVPKPTSIAYSVDPKSNADIPNPVVTPQVWGGDDAALNEFPHMVALGFYAKSSNKYKFNCGGTLISNRYVVTAAHCIANIEQNPLSVARIGTVYVPPEIELTDVYTVDDVVVDRVCVHPSYDRKKKINDIALVKLKYEIYFTPNCRPACLYTTNDDPKELMISGWGEQNTSGFRVPHLQKAKLWPVPTEDCAKKYSKRDSRLVIGSSHICAASSRSDACKGDSGGPLQMKKDNITMLVGVVAYGEGCSSSSPGVYTRISSYLDWIENEVWHNTTDNISCLKETH